MKQDKRIQWHRAKPTSLDLKAWKIAVIGGTGGLGRSIARLMASRGAQITVVGQTFRDADTSSIQFIKADLSLMREAERVAKDLPAEQLDLVLFTTGIFAAPERQVTAEGLERDMAISYLSRRVMVREMAPRLGKARAAGSPKARMFIMGFPGSGQPGTLGDLNAEKEYRAMTVHMNTVAGNEMLVLDAAKRYPHLDVFGLNPGLIKTNIRDNFLGKDSLKSRAIEALIGLFTPTPEQYAERMVPLLTSPDLTGHSGAMFDRKAYAVLPSPQLENTDHVAAFLAASDELVGRTGVRLS